MDRSSPTVHHRSNNTWVPPSSAADVENGLYLASGQVRRDELDNVFRFALIAMLVNMEVVLAEPLFEPVRLLRASSARFRSTVASGAHLWYGSPRTMVPAR